MKRLLLRADASARIGTGHVMRCIALAQAWRDMGGEVVMLSYNLPPALAARARAEGLHLLPLDGPDDAQETCKAAAEAKWVVIDGYQFDVAFCDRVVKEARHVLFIDDIGQLPYYPAELILNQNITASEAMYAQRSKFTNLLLGCNHALLRREFRRPLLMRQSTLPCERVLVTLGGSDPNNVTLKVINALIKLPQLNAKVVVGAANSRSEALRRRCSFTGGRIELLEVVDDMVTLMDWAQFAVSAGGTSVLELAARGLPALLIAIADNQIAVCESMDKERTMAYAGWHENVTTNTLMSAIRQLTSDASLVLRRDFVTRGLKLVDGRGALRVAREMMVRLAMTTVRVRRARLEDARQVFDWANDKLTRSVSFNQREITWDEHRDWFVRQLDNPFCRLLVGEDNHGLAIGMVRFDVKDGAATISINIAPEHRQRGLGTALILVACHDVRTALPADQVRALIKPCNAASQRTFHRAGFEPAPDVEVAGQQALCMVLK